MARWLLMLVFTIFAAGAITGCEVNADADDDGGRLEVDVDD